jgi:sugar-specific transcriptional regulator TrmB
VDVDEIIEQLRRVGMSGYEAKAYVALVAAGRPINGYEVAKRSGVPRSTVYETLGKLVARSAAFETTIDGNAVEYVALPPRTLFGRLRDETEDAVERLQHLFSQLSTPSVVHFTHSLATRADILARSQDLIASARTELMMFIWPEELETLEPSLRRAVAAGTDVVVMFFGDGDPDIGQIFHHVAADPHHIEEDLGCRLHLLVADRAEVVVAGLADQDGWGILTDDPAIAMVVREFIRYDITSQRLAMALTPEQLAQVNAELEPMAFNSRTYSAAALLRRLVPQAEPTPTTTGRTEATAPTATRRTRSSAPTKRSPKAAVKAAPPRGA